MTSSGRASPPLRIPSRWGATADIGAIVDHPPPTCGAEPAAARRCLASSYRSGGSGPLPQDVEVGLQVRRVDRADDRRVQVGVREGEA